MKRNIKILFILAFLQGMVFYASISTLYRQAAHLSLTEIGIIEAFSFLMALSMEMPWGILADRFGYKKTMVISNCLYFLSKVVFYRADGFFAFLFERFLLSMALAGISGVDTAILYLSCDKKESQKIFGIYYNLGNIGMMIASLIYSLFLKGDYRLSAFFTCFPFFLAMMLTFFLQEVDHEPLPHSRENLPNILLSLLKNKHTVLILIGAGLLTETIHEITAFLNQLLYVEAALPDTMFGLIHIGMTCIGFLSVLSYPLTQYMGRKRFLRILIVLSGFSCIVLYQFKIGWLCILAIASLELVSALFYPLLNTIQNEQVTITQRATQLSVFMMLMELTQMAVDISLFRIAEIKLSYSLVLGMALCLIGGILIIRNIEPVESKS